MTTIRVGSESYSLQESVAGASLGDLFTLKVQTRRDGFSGVSVKTISDTFSRVGELAAAGELSPADLLDDDAFLQNMIGLVFLARRKAGENITVEDAGRVSFTDIAFEVDEDDEESAPKDEDVSGPV